MKKKSQRLQVTMAGIQQIRSIQWIPNKRSSCRPKKIHSLEFQPILLLSGPFQWTSLVISVPRTSSPVAECAKRCWNWAILDDATLGDCFWAFLAIKAASQFATRAMSTHNESTWRTEKRPAANRATRARCPAASTIDHGPSIAKYK